MVGTWRALADHQCRRNARRWPRRRNRNAHRSTQAATGRIARPASRRSWVAVSAQPTAYLRAAAAVWGSSTERVCSSGLEVLIFRT